VASEHEARQTSFGQRGVARPSDQARLRRMMLGLVFLVALGMRGAHWSGQARHNPIFHAPRMDEGKHHEWAQLIASGEGLGPRPYFRAPLYYYLLGGLYAAIGPKVAFARALGCVLGAVTCCLLARLGIALGGGRVGLLAGLIAALYWPLVYFDALLLTVGLEVFLNVLMLLLLLAAVRRASLSLSLLAGVVWGLSAITRPNVLALAPGILAWIWIGSRLPDRPRRRLPAAALVFAGAALAVLPVTIRNRVVGGEWVLIATNGGVNFYIGNNPYTDGMTAVVPGTRADWQGGYEDTHRIPQRELGRELTEGEVSAYWFGKGLDWIRSDPVAWMRLMLHKLRLFWSPIEIANNDAIWFYARMSEVSILYRVGFPAVACLGIAGLVLVGREWRTWSLPVMFLLIYMATVVAFFCAARYRLPVVPVLILLSAQGLAQLPQLWQSRKLAPLGAYAGVGCLAALFLAANPPDREADAREMEGMAHYNLAMHYLQPERAQPEGWENAVEQLKQALELRPNDGFFRARARLSLAMAHMRLAVHLHDAGQPEKSEEQFALALRTEPAHAEPRTFYAAFLRLTGRLDEAAEQCHKALELQPDSPEARFELGLVLAERGRSAEAIDLLRQALAAARAAGQTDFAAEIQVELRRCERKLAGDRDE